MLTFLPCLDADEMAAARRRELKISRSVAAALGRSAVEVAEAGAYTNGQGRTVDWSADVQAAVANKISLPPDAILPDVPDGGYPQTRVQVSNETTLGAARRLSNERFRPVALPICQRSCHLNGLRGDQRALPRRA